MRGLAEGAAGQASTTGSRHENDARVRLGRAEQRFDPDLPGLALLCDPALRAEALRPVLPLWLGPEARLIGSRAYLRRLVPGKRCTVELELLIGKALGGRVVQHRLLGKVHGDGQGAAVFERLMELRRHGFGAGRFLVPRPIAYLHGHQLLLSTWTEGVPLSVLLLAGDDARSRVAAAAEWLLALGACPVDSGRRYSLERHLATLAGWKELLGEVYPRGERAMAELLARFEARSRELPPSEPRPTHRDFSPEHLVVDGDRLTGLDLDEFCQYDPLFDVAHFVAQLRFLGLAHFGRLDHFASLVETFRGTYETGARSFSEERLRLFEAISFFKLCRFVALVPWSDGHLVQQPQGWREILPELLSEARRLA